MKTTSSVGIMVLVHCGLIKGDQAGRSKLCRPNADREIERDGVAIIYLQNNNFKLWMNGTDWVEERKSCSFIHYSLYTCMKKNEPFLCPDPLKRERGKRGTEISSSVSVSFLDRVYSLQ